MNSFLDYLDGFDWDHSQSDECQIMMFQAYWISQSKVDCPIVANKAVLEFGVFLRTKKSKAELEDCLVAVFGEYCNAAGVLKNTKWWFRKIHNNGHDFLDSKCHGKFDAVWYALTNPAQRIRFRQQLAISVLSNPHPEMRCSEEMSQRFVAVAAGSSGTFCGGYSWLTFTLEDGSEKEILVASSEAQNDRRPESIWVNEHRPLWEIWKQLENVWDKNKTFVPIHNIQFGGSYTRRRRTSYC